MSPEAEHILDWFHLSMKLTVLDQYARGLVHCDQTLGEQIRDKIERLKWSLWHGNLHIPPNLVVRSITAHRKPPDVRICRLRNQSRVGTVPPSTSTPHWPACCARRW